MRYQKGREQRAIRNKCKSLNSWEETALKGREKKGIALRTNPELHGGDSLGKKTLTALKHV